MRQAILSDIHGNPLALNAVLADRERQGEVDAWWVLGDFAALGYDPVLPLERRTARLEMIDTVPEVEREGIAEPYRGSSAPH